MSDIAQSLLKYIGIDPEKVEDVDKAKKLFDDKFVPVSNIGEHEAVKSHVGKRIGEVETRVKKMAKNIGLEFGEGELKDKKIEDIMALTESKAKERFEELQGQAGKGDDEKLKALQDKVKELQTSYDEAEAARKTALNTLEEKQQEWQQQNQNRTLNSKKQKVLNDLKLRDDLREVEKVGFDNLITSKYNLKLTEGGELQVTDKEGKQIPNPEKAGDFLSAKDIFEKEAIDQGLITQNPHGKKPSGVPSGGGKPAGGEGEKKPKRPLARGMRPVQ